MKSGNLNFLKPSGPLQASKGTDLPLYVYLSSTVHVAIKGIFCSGQPSSRYQEYRDVELLSAPAFQHIQTLLLILVP